MKGRYLTSISVIASVIAVSGCGSNAGNTAAKDIHLDYAYYSPLSLVVREQHLLENRGYNVTWVLSAGSNKANEGLRSKALDVGSTAGSAALVARPVCRSAIYPCDSLRAECPSVRSAAVPGWANPCGCTG